MPRLPQATQLLRSTLAACSKDSSSAERWIRKSTILPSLLSWGRNSSSSGTACGDLQESTPIAAQMHRLEEKIENRAGWKSYAERPRRHFSVSAGPGVDLTHEIIANNQEPSNLDTDHRGIRPGLEVDEEILSQYGDESNLEESDAEFEISTEQREAIAREQDVMDVSEKLLAEQEVEESHCTSMEIQPIPFEAEQVEASASGNVDVEENADAIVEVLRDGGFEGDTSEILPPLDFQEGQKYLHVLSVAEVREVLEKARAKDLKVLYVKDSCEWTDYIVIASGRSTRHLRGMADAIVYKVKQRSHNVGPNLYPLVEGREAEQWMVVDLGDITIQLFLEEARSYYNLEEFWRKKKSVRVEN